MIGRKREKNKYQTSQVWLKRQKKTKAIFSHPERYRKGRVGTEGKKGPDKT